MTWAFCVVTRASLRCVLRLFAVRLAPVGLISVTLISFSVVDPCLEVVLCAACRRYVELFKFNTESTELGYARGAEMARLVPLGRSKARELLEGPPRWVHAVSITARQLLDADRKTRTLLRVRQNQCLQQRFPDHVLAESPPRSIHLI